MAGADSTVVLAITTVAEAQRRPKRRRKWIIRRPDMPIPTGARPMQTSLRCRRLAAALSRWRQTSAALQQEAMELRSKAATMADVQAEAAVLRAEVVGLREALAYEAERWRHIRVSSSLTEVQHWERLEPSADLWRYRWWPSWCPCCKRPLDVTIFSTDKEAWAAEAATRGNALPTPTVDRFAYAASLWGTSPGFVLGALVLGQALRRSGTRHDLVLMHTDDVPMSSRALLEEVWSLRLVDFVDAASGLFTLKGGRFDGVFTKLHVLGLTEYAKVLMLDIDIAVLHCPDDLFELSPPAAMCRGRSGAPHGSRIDGRFFFLLVKSPTRWSASLNGANTAASTRASCSWRLTPPCTPGPCARSRR